MDFYFDIASSSVGCTLYKNVHLSMHLAYCERACFALGLILKKTIMVKSIYTGHNSRKTVTEDNFL